MSGNKLSVEELIRYNRHMILSEIGEEGQIKLKNCSVLIIGAGGLGSPSAYYLAAAGVGKIGIVDNDTVELSNLQRQPLYVVADIGNSKTESAEEKLTKLNPLISINKHNVRLSSENAFQIIRKYDIVIDGSDNFPTRYLVNDACTLLEKPLVYGSIYKFEGQVSVFDAKKGPCYRCLYPEPPPPDLIPSCEEAGVLGILPGIIGSFQAMEAIKLALGIGDVLLGKLLLFNGLKMTFNTLKINKSTGCSLCGDHPTITELIDYNEFCGTANSIILTLETSEISPEELKVKLDNDPDLLLIDVRTNTEYQINRIEGSRLVSFYLLPIKMKEWNKAGEIIVYCKTGSRCSAVVDALRQEGFSKVKNLVGGIDAWIDRIDPTLTKY